MDAVANIGRNPLSRHQIQPLSMENEQAHAGRDDRTLRRERGQGKTYFPCSADHKQDWKPAKCDDTYIHTQVLYSTAI